MKNTALNVHTRNQCSPMTVAGLVDIVQSQLALYGDKALFIRSNIEAEEFQLFVGNAPILECVNYGDVSVEEHGLSVLAETLDSLHGEEHVICSCETIQKSCFVIGFRSDEGFIETIHSNELVQLTDVE